MFKGMSDLNSRAAKFSRQQAISAGCLATFRRGFSQLRVFSASSLQKAARILAQNRNTNRHMS